MPYPLPELPLPTEETETGDFKSIYTYTLTEDRLLQIAKENGVIIPAKAALDYFADLDAYLSDNVEAMVEKIVRKHLKDTYGSTNEIDTLEEPEQSEDDEESA